MQTKREARARILELCSESECGSWELWSTAENKTADERESIFRALLELLSEKKIRAMHHKFQGAYEMVAVNDDRLNDELKKSMSMKDVDPDSFYWFEATDEGKKEDERLRSHPS